MSVDADVVDPALRDPELLASATSRPVAAATSQQLHLESPASTRSDHHGGASHDDSPHNDAGDIHGALGDDAKRSRACEACRGLKVRCVPDLDDADGPCLRCKKARRNCVVTLPTRKRQKKTDSRVAELEKKIDALTASLHAKAGDGGAAPRREGSSTAAAWDDGTTEREQHPAMRRTSDGYVIYQPRYESQSAPASATAVVTGQKRKLAERGGHEERAGSETRAPPPIRMDESYNDIMSRGLITAEKAHDLFTRYNTQFIRHLPAVVFPKDMTVTVLRETKPVLFLAIMAAASGETSGLQRQLVRELMQVLAEKVVITGEKSLELVQALQIAVIWYWPPEHYEELKFYQLVHMCAVMAIDIGLGRRPPGQKSVPYGVYAFRRMYRRSAMPDPTTLEARRAWLACYFLASNTAMSLQRPLLIRWTNFMAESRDLLTTSAERAPTDDYFCALVWTHRISEDIGQQFTMDDPDDPVNINERRVAYTLKKLERDLDQYQKSLPKELMQDTLKISFGIVSLYMHEIVLHGEPSEPATQQPQDPAGPPTIFRDILMSDHRDVTTAHVNAISACLSNIDAVLDAFLAMDVISIRCLPVFNFVRVAYALVVLIKIYFSASSKDSELSAIINKDDLRVDFYIDGLLHKFRASGAEDRSRPAAKFLVVLVMLKGWFIKQNQDGGKTGASSGRETPSASGSASVAPEQKPQAPVQQQQQMANTPLHLLSEIATNDRTRSQSATSNNNTNNNGGGSSTSNVWNFGLRQASQPQHQYLYDTAGAETGPATATPPTGADSSSANPVFSTPFTGPSTTGTDFSPFNVNDLSQNLSFEELAASLGIYDTAGYPGTGPGFLGSQSMGAAAALEPAMAQDPWFGQWGDALNGMPPPGSGGPSATWGGMPPFQM